MIDVTTFDYNDSIWQDIYMHLTENCFDVYSPGTKLGECSKPYIVIKNNGGSKHDSFSTYVDLYSIMCYVPKSNYSYLEVFVNEVKRAMKGLMPLVKPTGQQSPSYYDDAYKAHMISIEYKNYKKM